MPQIINTNVASINAQRNLNGSQNSLATSLQRLSSGLRINSAKDDAAGLAISTRMGSQVRGLKQAERNSNDGISYTQTADGALGQMADMLTRIRELAIQSANGTNSGADRVALNLEVQQLSSELNRFALTTQFNGQTILDGTLSSQVFQVGANSGQTITATASNFRTDQYGGYQYVGGRVFNGLATSGASGNAISGAGAGAIATNQALTIQGYLGTSTIASGSAVSGASAGLWAEKVNALKDSTGVTASAKTEETLVFSGAATAASGATNSLTLLSYNSFSSVTSATISYTLTRTAGGLSSGSELSNVVTAINDKSATTGITARLNDTQTGVIITHDTGNRIAFSAAASGLTTAIATSGAAAASALVMSGSAAVTSGAHIEGRITYSSSKVYALSGTNVSGGLVTFGTPVSGGTSLSGAVQAATLSSVSTVDITSVSGAYKALAIADAAMDIVNNQRAVFGALQSRFDNTITNLQSSIENLSAAKSRILDADFAAETANLSRAQILQQAGIAALAQANALPNNVLALLQ